jgi:hypothetical protein
MRHNYTHRARRALASSSPILFAGLVAMTPLVIATLTQGASGVTTVSLSPLIGWSLLAGLIAGMALLVFQMRAEYRKRTYDPTWALKFSDIFDSKDMKCTRSKAARTLKDNIGRLRDSNFASSDVDDVLDFFEDLGFYMQGDQITPEVAHHSFHYWICGYYSIARDYLEVGQEKEPSRWEFVKILFDATNEIEVERNKGYSKKHLDAVELNHFLKTEIELNNREETQE